MPIQLQSTLFSLLRKQDVNNHNTNVKTLETKVIYVFRQTVFFISMHKMDLFCWKRKN